MFQLAASPEASGTSPPPTAPPLAATRDSTAANGSAVAALPNVGSDGRLSSAGFSALYQQHHRALWCIAAAIVRDRELAYDVVQEAAVIALGKLNEFDPATSFPAWCGQIVRFVALNQRKRNIRSHVVPTDPTIMAATAPAITGGRGGGMDGMFSGRLAAALETLDETARGCLLMKTVMDMSYKQIAEALGVPEGTAMSHVHRSRQALRKQLEGSMTDRGEERKP